MKIYNDLSSYKSNKKTFVTIGTFDGVHTGHQKVIKNLVEKATINDAASVLLTFFPHPRMVLKNNVDIKLINTIDERIKLLEKIGLEILIIQKFTKEFSNRIAFDFVKIILIETLKMAKLIIGYDHKFGKNREGNFEQLKEYGQKFNSEVEEISQLEIDNLAVSSTKIRKAIENGEIEKANSYLGYHFMLTGEVIKGKNLGEKLGFPTANLHIKETYKLVPKTGSYIVKAEIESKTIFGMMNIGFRPTVNGEHKTIEIHFFDFNKNLYGATIQIDVLSYLREEQKFESVELLKNQLQKDKEKSLKIIKGLFFDL